MKCPKCGGNMNLRETYYACNDDKNIGCDFYIDTGTNPEPKRYKDGEPCNHPGCLSHLSHPCEGCGRIGGVKPEPEHKPCVYLFAGNICHHRLGERYCNPEDCPINDASAEPEPEIISKSVHSRLEVQRPKQDERIREAFEKDFPELYPVWNKDMEEYCDSITQYVYEGYKYAFTSRNAEVEHLEATLRGCDKSIDRQNDKIEALKAEIESMQCCGNCGQEELPKGDKTCNSCKRGVEWSDADNWTRKPK